MVQQASLELTGCRNDPTVTARIEQAALSPQEQRTIAASIASVTVAAFKRAAA